MSLGRQDSIGSNVRFKDQNLIRNSFPNFEQIRRKGKLCDVTLIVEQQKFSAHKIVLAATIPFFDAMFLSGMCESTKREITIQGIDPAVLEAFITFAYTGEIQITPGNVQATLIGASFLHIDNVRKFCCRYIEERLNLENLLQVRNFASSFLCSSLVAACDRIIHENFEHLVTLPAFYASITGPELCKLLESDDLQVSSEECVFHSIIAWCEYQPEAVSTDPTTTADSPKLSRSLQSLHLSNDPPPSISPRLRFLPDLLARVRLPLLRAHFIRDVVSKNPHIRASLACRDLLDEARDLLLMPESAGSAPCSFVCRPRRGQEPAGVIYAVGGYSAEGDCQSIVEAYNPLVDRWEVVESMSTERSRIAVVALKGCLYAIGGLDGTQRLNTVERFDPKTGSWQRVASMNYRRSALGAAVLNDRIYVCGGYDGVSSLRTCEVYNPEQNRWQVIPSMTECRSAGGVVALEDGRLFAIGGHNGMPIFASVECYHRRGHQTPSSVAPPLSITAGAPSSRRVWRQVAPMLYRRCRHGVAVLRGRIFAAGGYNGCHFLRSVEVYDPDATTTTPGGEAGLGQWTEVASLATPRSRVALAASGGRLYAIGGFDGEHNLSTVECFQRCESAVTFSATTNSASQTSFHSHRHHLDSTAAEDDGRFAEVVVVDEDEDAEEVDGDFEIDAPASSIPQPGPSTSFHHHHHHQEQHYQSPPSTDTSDHHHQQQHRIQRRQGRSRSLRGRRPLRHCKSRDDENLEEWLEEGPRFLLGPRGLVGGLPFQTAATGLSGGLGMSVVNTTHSDEGSMDLPTVTTEGLDSTESLIESLTFQSSSAGELGRRSPPPPPSPTSANPAPPPPLPLMTTSAPSARPPPLPPHGSATAAASSDVAGGGGGGGGAFADWQWLPAMPLIAHEGGVGVGVLPLY